MCDIKISLLIFTALTLILVLCSESERLRLRILQPYKWLILPATVQKTDHSDFELIHIPPDIMGISINLRIIIFTSDTQN